MKVWMPILIVMVCGAVSVVLSPLDPASYLFHWCTVSTACLASYFIGFAVARKN